MNDSIKFAAEKAIEPFIQQGMTREAAEANFKHNVANKILAKQGGSKKTKSTKKNETKKQGGSKKNDKK